MRERRPKSLCLWKLLEGAVTSEQGLRNNLL